MAAHVLTYVRARTFRSSRCDVAAAMISANAISFQVRAGVVIKPRHAREAVYSRHMIPDRC